MATILTINKAQAIFSAFFSDNVFGEDRREQYDFPITDTMANGVAIDQCDLLHYKRYTIVNAATPQSLSLSDASLKNPRGVNGCAFVKVCGWIAYNRETTAANIITIGGGSNPLATLTTGRAIPPGAWEYMWCPSLAGFAVTATTGDIFKIATAAGSNVGLDLLIFGRSA